MTTNLINVSGWKCDCCGDPHPRGRRLFQREDGEWEESLLCSVRGSLALNANGEDWVCSACIRLVDIELGKFKRDRPERINAILMARL